MNSQSHVTSEETRRLRRGLQARDRTGFAATFRGNDEEAASPSTRSADRATIDPSPELAPRNDPRRKSDDAWTKMTETCTAPREDDSRGEQANKREKETEGEREREKKSRSRAIAVARDRGELTQDLLCRARGGRRVCSTVRSVARWRAARNAERFGDPRAAGSGMRRKG